MTKVKAVIDNQPYNGKPYYIITAPHSAGVKCKTLTTAILTHRLEEEFEKRFSFDFEPELWGTTAHGFLIMARQIMLEEIDLLDSPPDEEKQGVCSGLFSKPHPPRLFGGHRHKNK